MYVKSFINCPLNIRLIVSGEAIAGIVVGVLAAVGIAAGAYTYRKNKKTLDDSLLKNQSDHSFEEVTL